jgi:hypothetical protein
MQPVHIFLDMTFAGLLVGAILAIEQLPTFLSVLILEITVFYWIRVVKLGRETRAATQNRVLRSMSSHLTKNLIRGAYLPELDAADPTMHGIVFVPKAPSTEALANTIYENLLCSPHFRRLLSHVVFEDPDKLKYGLMAWSEPESLVSFKVEKHLVRKTVQSEAEIMADIGNLLTAKMPATSNCTDYSRPLWEVYIYENTGVTSDHFFFVWVCHPTCSDRPFCNRPSLSSRSRRWAVHDGFVVSPGH